MSVLPHTAPRRVAVVGAGMVGLATAWHLQEHGIETTVLERTGVAAGSSWGNAGWLTPALAVPLPEPAVLRFGVRAVLSPASPVYVPPTLDPQLLRFLVRFGRNCTPARWRRAMEVLIGLNNGALDAFAELEAGGINAHSLPAQPMLAAYRTEAEMQDLLGEIEQIQASGQAVDYEVVDGARARADEPALSQEIGAAIRINAQRYLDPASFVHALADEVKARGGRVVTGVDVDTIVAGAGSQAPVRVGEETYDAVVLATGALLGRLARPFGVRRIVQAGRGYSFQVSVEQVPGGPVYFPAQRLACTPVGDRLRIAGMMEFRPADAPLDPRRIAALVDAAGGLLRGADLEHRSDEWVGARPCTTDGLPLVGATRDPRVFVAGGHGMWGITLGPVTGKLLAAQIATGERPPELAGVDPLR